MNTDKLLATISFAFLALALGIIIVIGPAPGYEISIYNAYPFYFWLLLISSIGCSISILVRGAFNQDQSKWWMVGLIALCLANGIILLLPLFRDYAFYGRFDSLAYFGGIKDIQATGYFGRPQQFGEIFYPAIDILGIGIAYITGININHILMSLPAILFFFYTLSFYLLSRSVTKNNAQSILITAFGSILIYGWLQSVFLIRTETFLFTPLIIYLYYQSRVLRPTNLSYTILFLLIILSMPFFHPEFGGLFLIGMFLCIELALLIYNFLQKRVTINKQIYFNPINSMIPMLLVLAVWFLWFGSFFMFNNQINAIADSIRQQTGISDLETYMNWINRAQLTPIQTIEYLLRQYGGQFLFFIMPAIVTLLSWGNLLFNKKADVNRIIFSFIFFIWLLVALISILPNYAIAYTRALLYVLFAAAILNGLGISLLRNKFNQRLAIFISIIVLFIFSVVGIFTLHRSPITKTMSEQVTHQGLNGANWFLEYCNIQLPYQQTFFVLYSHALAVNGFIEYPRNFGTDAGVRYVAPFHFGYDKYQTYGQSIRYNTYFLNDKASIIRDPKIFPDIEQTWRWTPDDYEKLENDISVNKIFDSGEFEVFFISSYTATK